jgi:hypothetical protein
MAEGVKPEGSVEIFCSYSHKDESLRQEFTTHIALMRRQNLIQIWHDRKILAGDDWTGEIDEHLNTADIVTLFVSSDFLASDYCYEKEVRQAMQRESRKETLVVPIIVRPCDWKDAPFGRLQAIPTNARPVTRWEDRDEAWTDVAVSLKITVKEAIRRIHEKVKAELLPELPTVNVDKLLSNRTSWDELMTHSTPVEAERQKQQMNRWQILLDTQQKIFEIQQDVTARKSATQDAAYKRWSEYISQA